MKLTRQLIASLMLLAWLFATGHVLVEHGGDMVMPGHHDANTVDHEGDHHPDDAPGEDSHLHDLMTTVEQSAKPTAHLVLLSFWVPLCDSLAERMMAMLRAVAEPRTGIGLEESPLDERSSGWLLVCQTALPVRGPSLAA